jgi:hypothetical protein
MDWAAANLRDDTATVQERVFTAFMWASGRTPVATGVAVGGTTTVLPQDNPQLFAYRREYPGAGTFLAVVNFSDTPQTIGLDLLGRRDQRAGPCPLDAALDEDCERCGTAAAVRVSRLGQASDGGTAIQ